MSPCYDAVGNLAFEAAIRGVRTPGSTTPFTATGFEVSRRFAAQFVQFCELMVATLAIPPRCLSAFEKALSRTDPVQSLAGSSSRFRGNSESMPRTGSPTVAEFVLELLSWGSPGIDYGGRGQTGRGCPERVVRDAQG